MLRVPDDDALVAAGSPPLNSAVTLAGERLDSAGAVVSTFSLQSSMSAEFDLSFAAPLVLDASLDPSALSSRTLEVSLDGHAWLSAVELPEGELDAAGASALSAAAVGALRVRVMGLDAS